MLKSESINVTREQVIGWLLTHKDGDINDKEFQRGLINLFLVKAYVFDNGKVSLVFECFGGASSTIDIDMDEGTEDIVLRGRDEEVESSFKVQFGSNTKGTA